jgi:hypothetical protein
LPVQEEKKAQKNFSIWPPNSSPTHHIILKTIYLRILFENKRRNKVAQQIFCLHISTDPTTATKKVKRRFKKKRLKKKVPSGC